MQTGYQDQRAVFVIDAGIAAKENLALIESKEQATAALKT